MKQAHSGAHAAFATLGEAEAYLREACAAFGPLSDAQWRHSLMVFYAARAASLGLRYPALERASFRRA